MRSVPHKSTLVSSPLLPEWEQFLRELRLLRWLMRFWQEIRRSLQFVAVAAVLYTGWVLASRYFSAGHARPRHPSASPAAQADFDRIYGGTDVKILQFYVRDARLTEGDRSVICYGVLHAKSVRIDPPPGDGVFPALNRCVSVQPSQNTRYTLTAQGTDGHTVSESLDMEVRPDEAILPKITSFRVVDQKKDYRGRTVFLLTFAVQNAVTVDIDPHAFPTLHGAPNGRFYVAPDKTTTYTLIVTGKRGHKAQQQLTLEVPAG